MQTGHLATLNASSQAGDSLINQGTIGAILGGGNFNINGGAFVNKGVINVNNGDLLAINASNFSNSGTVNVVNAGTLSIGQGGSWSSTGKINVTDSTVNLLGTVTQAELNSITRAGGLVDLAGTMNLAGGTLNVGGTTAIGGMLLTGTIQNGTVHDSGLGLQFGTGSFPAPTLDGVIYQGAVDLSEASARVTVLNAFTVTGTSGTGPGTINLTGNNSNLTLTGSRTLDNATVRIGNAGLSIANPGSTTAVTFGPNLTIKQAGGIFGSTSSSISGSFSPSDSLLNQGSIFGSLPNGELTINGFGTFTNAGSIAFSNGDNLTITAGTVTNQSSITIGNLVVASFSGTSSFNNQGVVTAGNGDLISISAGTITNPGTMLIGGGSTLGISGFSSFANTGSLNLAAGATLNIGSFSVAWSSTGKITATDATVNFDGVVTQGQIAAITRVGGVIDIAGVLNNAGSTLNVGTGSAFGALVLTGTIAGGIIHDTGNGLTFGDGNSFGVAPVLDEVAYRGVLDLSEANARLTALDEMVPTGTAGTGAGTVNLTGEGSELTVGSSSSNGSQVLNNATINIGAAASSSFFSSGATLAAQSNFFGGGPTLLTLGPSLRLQHVGQSATLAGPTNAGDMLINRGTIAALLSGGSFTVTGNQFSNLGLISIANGDSLSIQSSSFTNAGTVNVLTGGTLAVGSGGDWISTGTIKETSSTVVLNGDVTLPEISSITRSGGTIVIAGRFDNQSSTLKVGTGSKLGDFVLSGIIDNGIVNDAGGGLVMHGGTLDTVTYQGLIDLSTAAAALTVLGGLTATDVAGAKAGTIRLTGAGSVLTLQEPQTLDNATISIGSAGGDTIAVTSPFFGGAAQTTTLGSKLLIQQTGLSATLSGANNTVDIIANAGTIAAGVSGGTFTISGGSFASGGNFANSGSITVSNKDTLNLAPGIFSNTGTVNVITGGILNLGTQSFFGPTTTWNSTGKLNETNGTINLSGTLTLANLNSITRSGGTINLIGTADLGGGTLNVGTGSALGALVVSGTIQNGTVHDADPGIIFGNGSGFGSSGTLNNVKYDGTMDLSEAKSSAILGGTVTFAGLNGTGLGTILLTGPTSSLTTQGSFLLDNAKVSLGGATLTAGTAPGQFTTVPALLTLGKNLSITHTLSSDSTTGFSSITSQTGGFGQTGSIISQGSITAGLKGGMLSISGGGFTNQGGISVSNGDSVSVTASSFSNSGMVSVSGGILTIGSANSFSPSTFANTGSVTVTAGGKLNLGPSFGATQFTWTSSGVLSETGGAITMNGPVTQANFAEITRSGGTVTLAGSFDNGNSATALNVGTGSKLGALVLTGSIANATVNDAGAGIAFQGFQSTLNHVTYQGTMDLSAAGSTVTVLNGLTLKGFNGSGAAKVLLTGSGSTMNFEGTQTLDNALLDIGGGASILAIANAGGAAVLTLGSKLNVVHTGGSATIGAGFNGSGNTIINQGSISAKVAGGALTIGGNGAGLIFNNQGIINVGAGDALSIAASTLTNSGSVNVTTGGVFNLGQLFGASTWSSTGAITETGATINIFGTTTTGSLETITGSSSGKLIFQGTLQGAGDTLNVGTGTALGTLQDTGTFNSVIVHDAGNGMWFFGPPHSGGGGAVFNGVTYQGMLNLSASQSNLTVTGGFTLTNLAGTSAGVANLTGAAAVLFAAGTETFDNFTLNMGNGEALGSTLFQTDPGAVGAILTLGSKLTINQVGAFVNVIGARNLGDEMVNGGKIMANYAGGQFLITEGSLMNNGSIIVGNNDTLTLDPDQLTNTGSLIINKAGTLRVDGALAGGTVNFTDKSNGTLMLGTPGSVTTTMVGFGATDAAHSDAIDLLNTVATNKSYSGTASSGVLTVTNAAAATVATLNFTGNYTTASFQLVSDGNGGTLILDPPVNANTVGAPDMQFVAGSSVVDASAGNDTVTLPGVGSAPETITGFGLSNGDMLDLHKLLAGSAWNGDPSTIANFVGVSADGGNTTISVDPSGLGGGSVVATLAGINTSLDELAAHGAIRFGWGGG